MKSAAIQNLNEALATAGLLGLTQRHREMQRASAVYWGLQYDGLPEWHDPKSKDLPLRKKKPSSQYRLTSRAVNEIVAHLFGKGRKPAVRIEGDEVDDARVALQKFYNSTTGGTGIRHHLGELGRLGLLHGQAVLAFHKRSFGGNTRYSTEVFDAKMCKPTFGRDRIREAVENGIDDDELIELDEYWYSVDVEPTSGEETLKLHRRLWTIEATTEFQPVPFDQVTSPMSWTEDAERTVQHGLGFVPAEWVWNVPVAGDIDGAPLLTKAEFKLEDAVNYAMSQLDRGIAYNQEPLTVFLGPNLRGEAELKRGGGNTVQLPRDPAGGVPDARMLELDGSGQQTAMDYVKFVRDAFFDVAQIVMHDPQEAAKVMSGTALERMMRPTIAQVDKIRPNYARGIARLLRKMLQADGFERMEVSCHWPEIVEPTATDVMQYQAATIQARDAELITERTALERVSPFYGIDDVEAYRREMAEEQAAGGTVADDTELGVEEL